MTLAALMIKNNIVKMILFKITAIIINSDDTAGLAQVRRQDKPANFNCAH